MVSKNVSKQETGIVWIRSKVMGVQKYQKQQEVKDFLLTTLNPYNFR